MTGVPGDKHEFVGQDDSGNFKISKSKWGSRLFQFGPETAAGISSLAIKAKNVYCR
jgi:hypothetical protein